MSGKGKAALSRRAAFRRIEADVAELQVVEVPAGQLPLFQPSAPFTLGKNISGCRRTRPGSGPAITCRGSCCRKNSGERKSRNSRPSCARRCSGTSRLTYVQSWLLFTTALATIGVAVVYYSDRAADYLTHSVPQLPTYVRRHLMILLGVGKTDTAEVARLLAEKATNLRIFEDTNQKMNRSLLDVNGAALVVSQFTLYGDARGGRRPSFIAAAPPEQAKALYEEFCAALRKLGVTVATGIFQAMMSVELVNEGPVTILLDSDKIF